MKRTTSKRAAPAKAKGTEQRELGDEALKSITGGTPGQPAKKLSTNSVRFDPYKSFKFR